MVNESKDPPCHVCDLAPCWSVKSCSYSVVFGFIRISKHKLGNSLRCVFFFCCSFFRLIKLQRTETIKGNFLQEMCSIKICSIQRCKCVPDGLSLVRMCTWTCSAWLLFFFSQHVLTIKNLKSSCGVPTSSISTHVQTHWRALMRPLFSFFFSLSRRRAAGLKDRLSEPVSALLHHKERTLVFPPLAHWSQALSLPNWSFEVQLTVTLAQQKIEGTQRLAERFLPA